VGELEKEWKETRDRGWASQLTIRVNGLLPVMSIPTTDAVPMPDRVPACSRHGTKGERKK